MFTFEQIQTLQEQGWTANQILDLIKAEGKTTSKNSKSKADKAPTTSEKSVSKSKTSTAKKSKTSSGSSSTKKKVEVPKLTADQLLNWSYYKKVRTNYCYAVMGCKVWKGKVTKPEGFVFDQKKWDKARADFEKVNKYVKKADR